MRSTLALLVFVISYTPLCHGMYTVSDQLVDAAHSGPDNPKTLEALLKKGAEPHTTLAATGKTVLHLLAENGYIHMAKKLFELDPDVAVNARDSEGQTPLHLAATEGRQAMCTLLVAHGASKKARDKYGWTPQDSHKRRAKRTWW